MTCPMNLNWFEFKGGGGGGGVPSMCPFKITNIPLDPSLTEYKFDTGPFLNENTWSDVLAPFCHNYILTIE